MFCFGNRHGIFGDVNSQDRKFSFENIHLIMEFLEKHNYICEYNLLFKYHEKIYKNIFLGVQNFIRAIKAEFSFFKKETIHKKNIYIFYFKPVILKYND